MKYYNMSDIMNIDEIHMHEIINHIDRDKHPLTVVYVGIGVATHVTITDYKSMMQIVDPKIEHQYPMCLKKICELSDNIHTFIVLIDPMLEDPPRIVRSNKIFSQNKFGDGWIVDETYKNIYYNKSKKMTVYACKYAVTYPGDIWRNNESYKNKLIDMKLFFDSLNKKSIINNWFSLIHDFSGRPISYLAKYYDKQLGNHRNHVIYGLGCRLDSGCYIDLTSNICQLVCNITDSGIKAFNPYMYDNCDIYMIRNLMNDNKDNKLICDSLNIYVDITVKEFWDEFNTFRRICLLRENYMENKMEHMEITDRELTHLNIKSLVDTRELLNNSKIRELHELCLKEFTEILGNVLKLLNINMKAENIMKELFGKKDKYKWIEILSKYIPRKIN